MFLLALFAVLALTGRKSVHTEILIPSEIESVWSVLTDLDKFDDWNSVLKLKEGHSPIRFEEGEKITYTFSQDDKNIYDITSTIKSIKPNAVLNQGGGMLAVLTFDHFYELKSTKDGVLLIIHEDYRGVGVHFWNPKPVEVAYQRLAKDIHNRVLAVYP